METLALLPRPAGLADLKGSSDEALAGAAPGSSEAGELLYRRYGAALERFCRSILADPHEAADAAHDTWLRALTALAGGADPANFKGWLFAIARNRCTDSFRVVRTEPLDGVAEDSAHPGMPLDERHEQQAEIEALWADLRSLSEAQRRAFVMTEVLGMTGEDVAASMQRSAESCRSLVADARTAVRERQRGRQSDCADVRAQLLTTRGRSRSVDAHLQVCRACRREARREHARRFIRSLVVVPMPVPIFARLRAVQGWLCGVSASDGALPDRVGAALAATVVAASIGIGANIGGTSGGAPQTPVTIAHEPRVAVAVGSSAAAARERRTRASTLGSIARRREAGTSHAPTTSRRRAPRAGATDGVSASTAAATTPQGAARLARGADAVVHLVRSELQAPPHVAASVPIAPAVVDGVEKLTAAVSDLSPAPIP